MLFLSFNSEFISAQTFSAGGFTLGSAKVALDLNDFELINTLPEIKAQFVANSTQWIRPENNLLTPRVLVRISINKTLQPIYIKYENKVIFPATNNQNLNTELYLNLYHPEPIEVYHDETLIDSINLNLKTLKKTQQKQWIDHSCNPYQVKITGAENVYYSAGCTMNRIGRFGSETPRLEVAFSSPNLVTPKGDYPPFYFYLNNNSPIETTLIKKNTSEKKNIKISAQLPDRMYRLKTAFGFGPYSYTSRLETDAHGPETAPSVMLYGKYELSDTSSIKFFDAALWNKSFFNNAGIYFSYDLARVLDGEIIFGALLGFQGLNYQYDKTHKVQFDLIYPQGFEATYNNPFGFRNKYLSMGMFASATSDVYRNIWIRAGSRIFYEINYITWGKECSLIEMWGLSVGIPLFRAF